MMKIRKVLVVALCGVAGMLMACASQRGESGSSSAPPAFDLDRMEIVDLSHSFDEETIYWPTSPSSFEIESLAYGETPGGYFYSSNQFCTPEHGGTHLDAPIHFAAGKWTADEIPLERLIGYGIVIDISDRTSSDADYRLSREDVLRWEGIHGEIPEGAIVLLRTGWSERWPDRRRYLGDDTPGDASNLHFPSFGADAARYLVEQRRVAVLGVDTASIDYGATTDFIVHQIANGANVPGLENLTNLDQLPPRGAWIIALPLKIDGGSGSPLRVVALLEG